MLIKDIIVGVLVVFFSLGLAGVALAEPEEASYVYPTFSDHVSSPMNVHIEQEEMQAGKDKAQVEKGNKRRLLCADFGIEKVNATDDCNTLYGS